MTTPKIDLEIFDTEQTFADIGLNENLRKAVDKAGFVHPTIIQAKLIPLALSGTDVLGQSRTGSGKTAAFWTPCTQHSRRGGCLWCVDSCANKGTGHPSCCRT